MQSGDHILQIGDVNLRGMGSEQVAAVLRQSGTHVRLVVARPVEPTSPDYQVLLINIFFLIFTIFQTLHHVMETLNILRCLEIESWNFAKIRIWNWKYLENLRLQKFKRRIEEFWNLKIGRFEDYLKDNLEKNCKKCNEIYFKSLRSWEIDTLNVQNIEKIENCVVGDILFFFCWNYFS